MSKGRREINHIRTDKLEYLIAAYIELGEFEKADAVRDLAEEIGAPILQENIDDIIETRDRVRTRMGI